VKKTVQNGLDSYRLSRTKAVNLVQNRPLWRHYTLTEVHAKDDNDIQMILIWVQFVIQSHCDSEMQVTWRTTTMRSRARSTLRRQHKPRDLTAWLRTAGSVFWMPGRIYHKTTHWFQPQLSMQIPLTHF